jgi:hypothetical protein
MQKSRANIRSSRRLVDEVKSLVGAKTGAKAVVGILQQLAEGNLVVDASALPTDPDIKEVLYLNLTDVDLLDRAMAAYIKVFENQSRISRETFIDRVLRLYLGGKLVPSEPPTELEALKPRYSSALAMRGLSQSARIVAFDR